MSKAEETIKTKWPKIFLFGDSITQLSLSKDGGWASLVGDFFNRRCDLVIRGFSGYNTRHCKYVLPKVLDKNIAKEVVAMTIFLGANDSATFEHNPQQHVPVEEFKETLKGLVEYSMSVGVQREKIILISPPVIDAAARKIDCDAKGAVVSRELEVTALYAQACGQAAKELGVNSIDLFSEMRKLEDPSKYLNDGLHLSEKGSQFLFDLLKPVLEQLTSEVPPILFPEWRDIDNKDPEPAFQAW